MSEVESFAQFFNLYKSSTRNTTREPNKTAFYTLQKLLWMSMQIESKSNDVQYMSNYHNHAIRMTDSFCIYKYGVFYFIYTKTGNVYIENPSSERDQILRNTAYIQYTINSTSDRAVSYNEHYIVSGTGMIVFRDLHDQFYELQYQGRGYEAIEYALRILGVR